MKSDLLRANENPENKIEPEQLRKALVEYLYYQGLPGIRGSLLAAVILTVALWNDASNLNLVVWFAAARSRVESEAMVRAFHKAQRAANRSFPGARFAALTVEGCRGLPPSFYGLQHIPSGLGNIRPGNSSVE
jgi:hypothetical protein